jgi:hypothetical protein
MMPRILRPLSLALTAVVIAACGELPFAPAPDDASLRLTVNLASAPVETLVAEVTAADLDQPLVFNIPVEDGRASGTLRLPAGDDRTLTLRAFNTAGAETHRGEATLQVRAGENPAVEITLLPLHGDQPIDGVIGSVVVEVDPPSAEVAVDGYAHSPPACWTGKGRSWTARSSGSPSTPPSWRSIRMAW